MNKEHNKLYYIPPSWNTSLIFAFCAFMFFLFIKYDIQSKLAIYTHFHKPAVIISCILAILATTSYSFYSDRLEVSILLFPIRCVYWKNVTGAMYFKSLTSRRNTRHTQPYMIICISPCQPAILAPNNFAKFDRKNARYLVRIPISKIEAEVINLIEQLGIEVYRNIDNQ